MFTGHGAHRFYNPSYFEVLQKLVQNRWAIVESFMCLHPDRMAEALPHLTQAVKIQEEAYGPVAKQVSHIHTPILSRHPIICMFYKPYADLVSPNHWSMHCKMISS